MNGLKFSIVAAVLGLTQVAQAESLSLRLNYAQGRTGMVFQATHAQTGNFAVTPKRDVVAGKSWRLVSRNAKGVIVNDIEVPDGLEMHVEAFNPKTGAIEQSKTVQHTSGVLEVSIPYDASVASIELLKPGSGMQAMSASASSPLVKFDRAAIGNIIVKSKTSRMNMMAASAALGGAPTATTIVNSGPAGQRMDLVLVGDGYTAAEMGKWQADASRIAAAMMADPLFAWGVNFRRVDVASVESGVDEPAKGIYRNTAFDGAYDCFNVERGICVNDSKVYTAVGQVLAPDERDFIVVVVNSERYGGMANYGGLARIPASTEAPLIALHELGHSAFLLADEYVAEGTNCLNGAEPAQMNVTRDASRSSAKWGSMIAYPTVVPTPPIPESNGMVGMYLGGNNCAGVYRPTYSSKMRNYNEPWHLVNETRARAVLAKYATPCPDTGYIYFPTDPKYGQVCRATYSMLTDEAICADTPWEQSVLDLRAAGWTVAGTSCSGLGGNKLIRYNLYVKPKF